MLSWSSSETTGDEVDLTSLSSGADGLAVEHAAELWAFATACAGSDDSELARARAALIAVTDHAFMVDAAAVAANFEMMTRLADSTGARMQDEVLDGRRDVIDATGIATLDSRR